MSDPSLVLFDEPASALATKLVEAVMKLIHDEMKQRRTAAVIVTHDLRMVQYAERLVHITDGVLEA